MDQAFATLNNLLAVPRRDTERSSLLDMIGLLNEGEALEGGKVAFPEGTGKEWEAVLAEFSAEQRQ